MATCTEDKLLHTSQAGIKMIPKNLISQIDTIFNSLKQFSKTCV